MEIINGIGEDIPVKVYTNFTFPQEVVLGKIERPVIFYGSYHPVSGRDEKVIATLNALRESDLFEITIHAIHWNNTGKFLEKAKKRFERNGWNLMIDDDQYQLFKCASQRFRKRVLCKNKIVLIGPNGQRFPCGAKLFKKDSGRELLTKEDLLEDLITTECEDYGYCAPCDGLIEGEIVV